MMTGKAHSLPLWLLCAAAVALAASPASAQAPAKSPAPAKTQAQTPAQNAPGSTAPALPETPAPAPVKELVASPIQLAPAPAPSKSEKTPDRLKAYYHLGLASIYEEDAAEGHAEDVPRAIEEYKLALDADPNSPS